MRIFFPSVSALLVGVGLDLLLGDPEQFPHLIRLYGTVIMRLEQWLRRVFPATPAGERRAGCSLVVLMLLFAVGSTAGLLWLCEAISPTLRWGCESLLCYEFFAMTSLRRESLRVYRALAAGELAAARAAVARIVGRDTAQLDEAGVTRAAVETVAENTADGVIAPLLFWMVGGVPLMAGYKAINTMDSMVGYRNERYLHFGRSAARLDDAANFLPARLSAIGMLLASFLLKMSGKNAIRIFRRDRFCHASPNSAQTEAVCAGALGVQLAGDACYFGKRVEKPTIGDPLRPIVPDDIRAANRLLVMTTVEILFLVVALRCRMGGF